MATHLRSMHFASSHKLCAFLCSVQSGQTGACTFDQSKGVVRVAKYGCVIPDSEPALQQAVDKVGPVAAAVYVQQDSDFYVSFQAN